MANKGDTDNTDIRSGGVTIGNVYGGIRDTIIAGRDVIFPGSGEEQRDIRNRRNMLQLVWNTWIEGVLKQSLYNEVLIELGMETQPDAVQHPWEMVMQMPEREETVVTPGISMLELFDQANGSLLILGEPGSGKTTMLLELCRQLIERGSEEATQQIPVAFNLSTWKPDHKKSLEKTFADWLVSELKDKYYVPNKIGHPWVEKDELVLLLDGLDEISDEYQDTCVQAINAFRAEHNMPLAVCSRNQDYKALATQFAFSEALLIQPLTNQQVDQYFQAVGEGLTNVHQALKHDPDLQALVQTPLILGILVLTYQNASRRDLIYLEVSGNYRKHLFNVYTARMFRRRTISQPYTPKKTLAWLSWLAQMMVERKQTIFIVENIQPSWLNYSSVGKMLLGGLIYGLVFGLIFGPIFGLIFGVLIEAMSVGLVFGLIFGLIFGLLGGWHRYTDKKPIDKLSWSWKDFTKGSFLGLLGGLIGGLIGGLKFGLFFGLLFGPIWGLLRGLNRVTVNIRSRPGEGITTSLKHFVIVALLVGPVFGTVFVLDYGLIMDDLFGGLIVGLLGGLIVGLGFGFFFGGDFLINHFTTRWLFYGSGRIPWKLIDFLEYAKERIFLRRVGGGYIFIHRMLMEHFAEMTTESVKSE